MTELHPLARAALRGLIVPDPEGRERLLASGVVDLASNLMPDGGPLSPYPPLRPWEVQRRYIDALTRLDGGGRAESLRAEQVLLTCGSVDGINLLVATFAEPHRDRVCVCPPTFPFYARAAAANDIDVRPVPLTGEDFERLDVAGITAVEPKLTFLCSPSNPVGSVVDRGDIEALLDAGAGLVVVDEAYVEFSRRPSVVELLDRHDRLVVLRTFSKAFGLAGARLGVVIANPAIIETLRVVQLSFAVSRTSLDAASVALADADAVAERVREVRIRRDQLAAALARSPKVTKVFASESNFVLARFDDGGAVYRELLDAGILVADVGRQVANTLRITVGTVAQCDALLAVLSC